MLLKSVKEAGYLVAWCSSKKNGTLLATCSAATGEEAYGGVMQIHNYDIFDKTKDPQVLGVARADFAFTSLSWSPLGEEDQRFPLGIVLGGMNDGSLTIWDANAIITAYRRRGSSSDNEYNIGLLATVKLYEHPVYSLEHNPFKPHLIATGSTEVLVINLERDLQNPDVFSPGEPNHHEESIVTSVSWNRKVPHILGSASQNGVAAVWDLKTNRAIFNFADTCQTGSRVVSLTWSPEIPTQLAIVYDDEKLPELQVWDLRNPQGPVHSLGGIHTKGIFNLSWNELDPTFILSIDRDDVLVCWNIRTGEVVAEEKLNGAQAQIAWSKKLPGVFSSASTEGTVGLYQVGNQADIAGSQLSNYAPTWLKTPVVARFSPLGVLAVASESERPRICQFVINHVPEELQASLDEFDQDIKDFDVHGICDRRSLATNENEQDRLEWLFIRAVARDKAELVKALGFDKNEIIKQAEKYTGKTHRRVAEEAPVAGARPTRNVPAYDFASMTAKDAEGFFDQLSSATNKKPPVAEPTRVGKNKQAAVSGGTAQEEKEIIEVENIARNVNWNAGVEKIIKENILVGNIEGAIDCAMKNGRVAEALLIAHSHSSELFEATSKAFFTASKDPFIKNVFRNFVDAQYLEVANGYDLSAWRELIVLAATAASDKEFLTIMNSFGDRLVKERKDFRTACLFAILGKNWDKLVEVYVKRLEEHQPKSVGRYSELMNVITKLIIFKHHINNQSFNDQLDQLVIELVNFLVEHRRFESAYTVLLIANDRDIRVLRLKDLLYQNHPEFKRLFKQPPLPYHAENVAVKPKPQPVQTNPQPGKTIGQVPIAGGRPIPGGQQPQPVPGKPAPGRPPLTAFVPGPATGPGKPVGPPTIPEKTTGPINPPPPAHIRQPPPVAAPLPGPINPAQPVPRTGPVGPPPPARVAPPPAAPVRPPPPTQIPGGPSGPATRPHIPPSQLPEENAPPPNRPPTFPPQAAPPRHEDQRAPVPPPVARQPPPPVNAPPPVAHPPPQRQPVQPPAPAVVRPPAPVQPPPTAKPGIFAPPKPATPVNQPAGPGQPVNRPTGPPPMGGPPKPAVSNGPFDRSSVPAESQHIVDAVSRYLPILEEIERNPKTRADAQEKIELLFRRLAARSLKPATVQSLETLADVLDQDNVEEALKIHSTISRTDWEANKDWLIPLKRLLVRK